MKTKPGALPFTHFRAVRQMGQGYKPKVFFGRICPAALATVYGREIGFGAHQGDHSPRVFRTPPAPAFEGWSVEAILKRQAEYLTDGLSICPPCFVAEPLTAGEFEIAAAKEPEAINLAAVATAAPVEVKTMTSKTSPRRTAR